MVNNVTIVLTVIGTLLLGVLFSTAAAKADTKDNSSYEYSYYCESDICTYEYQIQWGDTLSQLSIEHQIRITEIVQLNNIKNPNLIFANDYLTFLKQSNKKRQDNKKEDEKETPTIRNIVDNNPFSKKL